MSEVRWYPRVLQLPSCNECLLSLFVPLKWRLLTGEEGLAELARVV